MRWLIRTTSPEERRRILGTLFGDDGRRRWHRFAVLMALSVVVAAMGLSLDSAAVVIGAMLLAPLMTPIMACAAAIAMGWPGRALANGAAVVVISGASIGLSWLLARAQPGLELTDEMLARTAPDGRDLAVALAAGAAGAYATAREDISGALPGVAVAVALVPPLTTVGLMLELGRYDLAEGAGLLFAANLVAILLVSILVLLVTGFVPVTRLTRVTPRVAVGVLAALAATVGVAIPLAQRSFAFADRQETQRDAEAAVTAWLGVETPLEIEKVSIDGSSVVVDLVGPEAPPPAHALAVALAGELGDAVEIQVRWSQRSIGVDSLATDDAEEPTEARLRPLIDAWLREAAGDGPVDRVESIELDGEHLVVSVVGPVPPPSAATLATALEAELGAPLELTVRWIEQRLYASDAPPDAEALLRDAVRRWASQQPGLVVVSSVSLLEDGVVVDLAGERPPLNVSELEELVERELGEAVPVRVRFTERQVIYDTTG